MKVCAGSDIKFWHVYSPQLKYVGCTPKLNVFTFYIHLENCEVEIYLEQDPG